MATARRRNDGRVGLHEIDQARQALDQAHAGVEAARQAVRDAQDEVRARRRELHAAIVQALREGVRVGAAAAMADLTREQVRRIARAGGIEPDDR